MRLSLLHLLTLAYLRGLGTAQYLEQLHNKGTRWRLRIPMHGVYVYHLSVGPIVTLDLHNPLHVRIVEQVLDSKCGVDNS